MKAIGYIRVSTSEQANEGISLDNQRYKIKTYADLKNLDLVEIISDEGISGKDLKRPGVEKLIHLIKSKKINSVIVYKLDRLTRKTKDLLYLFEDIFNKNNIHFYSLNENIDTTTAQGKFFLTLMGGMAQMERDLISERTQDALQELVRQKRRLGNPDKAPFGFRQTKRKKAVMSDLKPVPKEIGIVKLMFRMRKDKNTFEAIGKKFGLAKSSVKYILDNEIYQKTGILCSAYVR
ncbi:MAG: recombinase family protein [bacterium]